MADAADSGGSGAMPLSDEPLTADERIAVRRLLLAAYRRRWFLRQLKVTIPLASAIGATMFTLIEWLRSHLRL